MKVPQKTADKKLQTKQTCNKKAMVLWFCLMKLWFGLEIFQDKLYKSVNHFSHFRLNYVVLTRQNVLSVHFLR